MAVEGRGAGIARHELDSRPNHAADEVRAQRSARSRCRSRCYSLLLRFKIADPFGQAKEFVKNIRPSTIADGAAKGERAMGGFLRGGGPNGKNRPWRT